MVATGRDYSYGLMLVLLFTLFSFQGAKAQDGGRIGLWLSDEELSSLPVTGDSWEKMLSYARNTTNDPDLQDQDDKTDTNTVAKALVYARTGDTTYAEEVVYTLQRLLELHPVSRSLEWDELGTSRAIGAYVIAADLIELESYAPDFDKNHFRPWLASARFADTEGGRGSIVEVHEKRPNNHGTHASASRIASALYLDDTADLDRAIRVFRGWLGDRASYSGFKYGDLSWQVDGQSPVGINPKGSQINGFNVDGVLPDDQRRGGSFAWPPPQENYVWEGLQGVVTTAELLHRAGYPAYEWSDRAILRAVQWLHNTTFADGQNYPAEGDDVWQIYIINKRYGTTFPSGDSSTTRPGKMIGYTDWTHSTDINSGPTPPPPQPDPEPDSDPDQEPDPEPESSALELVSAKFHSASGNLKLQLASAAPGSAIRVTDASGTSLVFGTAPDDGSVFTVNKQFYTGDRSCTYRVTDGVSQLEFSVRGSRKHGCGSRR